MAKEAILPSRTLTAQPDANASRKDQKGYQLPEEYDAQVANQEFDRLHERVNKIVVEAAALADLSTAYAGGDLATASDVATALNATNARINALAEILRDSGLLRRS